jgi:hypothetical protein
MKPKTKSKPKKLDEPIVDPGGWYTISQYGREIVLANLDLT